MPFSPLTHAHSCAAFTTLSIVDDAFQSSGVEIFPLRIIHVAMQLNTGETWTNCLDLILVYFSRQKLVNSVTEVNNFQLSRPACYFLSHRIFLPR